MKTYLLYPTKEQEDLINSFLETNNIYFFEDEEVLPQHVLDGIACGEADVEAGKFVTLEDFKKRFPVD